MAQFLLAPKFRRVAASEDLSQLLKLSGALSANAIFEIESFVKGLFTRLRAAIDSSKPGDKVEIILRLSMPDLTEFKAEMQRVPFLK